MSDFKVGDIVSCKNSNIEYIVTTVNKHALGIKWINTAGKECSGSLSKYWATLVKRPEQEKPLKKQDMVVYDYTDKPTLDLSNAGTKILSANNEYRQTIETLKKANEEMLKDYSKLSEEYTQLKKSHTSLLDLYWKACMDLNQFYTQVVTEYEDSDKPKAKPELWKLPFELVFNRFSIGLLLAASVWVYSGKPTPNPREQVTHTVKEFDSSRNILTTSENGIEFQYAKTSRGWLTLPDFKPIKTGFLDRVDNYLKSGAAETGAKYPEQKSFRYW